jgi:hypothetical protein
VSVTSASRSRVGALLLVVAAAGAGLSLVLVRGRLVRLLDDDRLGAARNSPMDAPARHSQADGFQPIAVKPKSDPPTRPAANAPPTAEGRKPGIGFGNEHPGASALRAEGDWYCEYNRKAIDEQARREGLTTEEVKELTVLGFAALKTTQPAEVQKVLGRELSPEELNRLGAILSEENESFKKTMRLKVKGGASLEERWRTIQEFESQYVQLLYQTFGITGAQFDQMLTTNADPRIGAHAVPLPAHVPAPPPEAARPAPPQVPIDHPNRKPDPAL